MRRMQRKKSSMWYVPGSLRATLSQLKKKKIVLFPQQARQSKDFYMGAILVPCSLPGLRVLVICTFPWTSFPTSWPWCISLYLMQGWGQASCPYSYYLDIINIFLLIDPYEMNKLCSSSDSDTPSCPTLHHVLFPCVQTIPGYRPFYDKVESYGESMCQQPDTPKCAPFQSPSLPELSGLPYLLRCSL